MEKKSKFLSPIKTKIKNYNQKFMGFDIETQGELNEFVLACFTCDEFTYYFKSKQEVIQFMNSHWVREYKIVATNLGFDFLGTFLEENNLSFSIKERNGIVYSAVYYQHGIKTKTVKFYDTVRFFPASVEKLGKIVNLSKQAHPKCFGKIPQTSKDWQELKAYCQNDAYISYLFMKNFVYAYITKHNLQLKDTIASIALSDFRTNYLTESITIESFDKHKLAFEAYYGGRTEVFRRGYYKNVRCYDFNSLYPSVMSEQTYPNPSSGYISEKISLWQIEKTEGVVQIEGFQEDTFIPVLPVRTKTKLIFPTGFIKGTYTFVELREAMKNGFTITKTGKGVYYTKTKPYFKEFVTDKYNTRLKQKEQKDPLELMTKLIMNSLYGKWGFNYRESSEIKEKKNLTWRDVENAICIEDLGFKTVVLKKESTDPTNYSFPIWSSYITAYARIKLYRAMKQHKEKLLYCDTDSLFVSDNYTISDSKQLGKLAEEYYTKDAIFVRPKFYFTTKGKIKGVKTTITKEFFFDILKGKTIKEDFFVKYRSVLRTKEHHKFGKLRINQVIEKEKKLNIHDTKRVWKPTFNFYEGETSKPITIKDKSFYDFLTKT